MDRYRKVVDMFQRFTEVFRAEFGDLPEETLRKVDRILMECARKVLEEVRRSE